MARCPTCRKPTGQAVLDKHLGICRRCYTSDERSNASAQRWAAEHRPLTDDELERKARSDYIDWYVENMLK